MFSTQQSLKSNHNKHYMKNKKRYIISHEFEYNNRNIKVDFYEKICGMWFDVSLNGEILITQQDKDYI